MATVRQIIRFALPAAGLLLACMHAQAGWMETEADLQAWMDGVRKNTSVQALPLKESHQFAPFRYSPQDKADPFDAARMAVSVNPLRLPGGPDPDRRKEALEAFPVEALKMVGTIYRDGKRFVLLKTGKMVYQAQVGNYVGQNLGKIVRITDTAIDIVETLPDENRGWTNRRIRLELLESTK